MRLLAVAVFCVFVASPAVADDKPEAKAKEAALALLKAVKAKDAEAILKLSTTPFLVRESDKDKVKILKETADVKAWVKERLDELKDTDKVPTELDKLAAFTDVKENIKDEADRKMVQDTVGPHGFVALVKSSDGKNVVILIGFKDGKAKIVGIGTN